MTLEDLIGCTIVGAIDTEVHGASASLVVETPDGDTLTVTAAGGYDGNGYMDVEC
jgi:hypothetical protein